MNKAVIFGAGNIGRSFIGNIFSSNGMGVTFIDANAALVKELNLKKEYRIIIKRNNNTDEEIQVKNIKAVHSSETDKIIKYLAECDICATSVGQGALPKVLPLITKGIKIRNMQTSPPLDIIIAENIRNGADYFRKVFKANGLSGDKAGLIETSIGKMVPLMTAEDLSDDPLVLHAEEYNTLILDRKGFKNKVPDFPEIRAVENIAAWVDRKLFIHNLGHAASAYLGFEQNPEKKLIAEVLEDDSIKLKVRKVMIESAAALVKEYPADFTEQALIGHIDDLLFRFQNKALGDTVFRVGRDLPRKLGRDDRILGAAGLCLKHDLSCREIIDVFHSALQFEASDQNGELFRVDAEFIREFSASGSKKALTNLCSLNPVSDKELIEVLLRVF
ncbi:MAG: mannitol-1-phosphate 5-dehydrogenase [Spirochaetales bacterium]|nr:mannitol-1-phosphate 5-dehydrogenase [Spirochaetales bacterium]